jgi:hypothetical protein
MWNRLECSPLHVAEVAQEEITASISNLKIEATYFSETSPVFQRTTRLYLSEDRTLHKHGCEELMYSMQLIQCGGGGAR